MVACREPEEDLEGSESPDPIKMFVVESSGMFEQGSHWILKRFEQPTQRNFGSWIAECGLKLMYRSVGTRREEGR